MIKELYMSLFFLCLMGVISAVSVLAVGLYCSLVSLLPHNSQPKH